ncbi:MAG: DsrE family protein [Rhodocyclaceae bacterium]|nr:DsrE family protein [Rhodocyclaceae bacterium]
MIRKALVALALVLFGFTLAVQAQTTKPGVVVQVSDDSEKNWSQAINVVRNIQAEYGKGKVDVELVVFGHGTDLLKFDSPLANRIDDLLASGAQVVMCENTMKARKLTSADMHAKIGYVKAGVVEIIEKQKQGWAVVRP